MEQLINPFSEWSIKIGGKNGKLISSVVYKVCEKLAKGFTWTWYSTDPNSYKW